MKFFLHFFTIFSRVFGSFPRVFQILCWDFCLKATSEQAGIGLRRENFGIPESKISKPSFS